MITRTFQLDVSKPGSQHVLYMRQGDTGTYRLLVSLCDGSAPVDLTDNLRAELRVKKPDSNEVTTWGAVMDKRIMVYPHSQVTAAEGIAQCMLVVYGGSGAVLYSPCFDIMVERQTVNDESIESSTEYAALVESITRMMALEITVEEEEALRRAHDALLQAALLKFNGLRGSCEMVDCDQNPSLRVIDYDDSKFIEVRVPRNAPAFTVDLGRRVFALHVDEHGHLICEYNDVDGLPPFRLIDGHLYYVIDQGELVDDPQISGGMAETAARLETPRVIALTGAAAGSTLFDGSADVDIPAVVETMSNEELNELLG